MNFHPISCARCRKFKRKCTRELPVCSRCRRLGFDCGYPPSRRRPADIRNAAIVSNPPRHEQIRPVTGSLIRNGQLTSQSSGLALLDVYFSVFMPSTIIFHQPHVKQRYLQGNIPTYALDSILAMAAFFSGCSKTPRPIGAPQINVPGEDWATCASALAANQPGTPTLDVVKTFYNLAAYWCAVGNTQKYQENADIAFQLAKSLASQYPTVTGPESREVRKSCLWIIVACQCLSNEESLIARRQPAKEFESQHSSGLKREDALRLPGGNPSDLVHREIMEFAKLCLEARQLVYGINEASDVGMKWAALFNFEHRIRSRHQFLVSTIQNYDGSDGQEGSNRPEIIALKALYYMSRIMPYLGLLILIGKQNVPSQEHMNFCAQVAVQGVNDFGDMMTKFMAAENAPIAAVPPFVAYSAFLSLSISLGYMALVESRGISSGGCYYLLKSRVLSSIILLDHLRHYWAPIKKMWEELRPAFENANITNADIQSHFEALKKQSPSLPLKQPRLSYATDRQLEASMITNLSQVMSFTTLVDPAYITVGIFRPFPIGKQTSPAPAIDRTPPPARLTESPQTTHSSPRDASHPKTGRGAIPSANNSGHEIPGWDLDVDPATFIGMMQMVLLDGFDVLCN